MPQCLVYVIVHKDVRNLWLVQCLQSPQGDAFALKVDLVSDLRYFNLLVE